MRRDPPGDMSINKHILPLQATPYSTAYLFSFVHSSQPVYKDSMRHPLLLLLLLIHLHPLQAASITLNTWYPGIAVSKSTGFSTAVQVKKNTFYQFYVMQDGFDVELILTNSTADTLAYMDTDNGTFGHEIINYLPNKDAVITFHINGLSGDYNPNNGTVGFYIKAFTKKEKSRYDSLQTSLIAENKQHILTADIDHFWSAFDKLAYCKNHYDSLTVFQNEYLDAATNGLQAFMKVRALYAPEYLKVLKQEHDFYAGVRNNTYLAKTSSPLIEAVFDSLEVIYPHFKPFQVCFAIGAMRTGGTTTDQFILIGTELTTTGNVDRIPQRIKSIVAHESIHTQQKYVLKQGAIACNQLDECLDEGIANFIAEIITGTTNYGETDTYGYAHEAELWQQFKQTLCAPNADNWLYNGDSAGDKPADLGYFIGYRIAKTYYQQAENKQLAIIELIECDDPLDLLVKSGYDGK